MTPFTACVEIGERFGKLEVFEFVEANGDGRASVRVKCDCGARLTVEARSLAGRPGRWVGLRDCGGHSVPSGEDPRRMEGGIRRGGRRPNGRPGVEAGGHATDVGWPVAYLVVAGGQRTEHDTFEEAASEFRLRSGRKAA